MFHRPGGTDLAALWRTKKKGNLTKDFHMQASTTPRSTFAFVCRRAMHEIVAGISKHICVPYYWTRHLRVTFVWLGLPLARDNSDVAHGMFSIQFICIEHAFGLHRDDPAGSCNYPVPKWHLRVALLVKFTPIHRLGTLITVNSKLSKVRKKNVIIF